MKVKNGLMGIVLLGASALSLTGCLSTYGEMVVRDLTHIGMQQAVVSGVQNSIEGPRGTTVNVTPGVNNVVQQKYYDGKMSDGSYYKGEIETVNNKPHGFGTYTSPDGWKYDGQFKDGKYDGQGTYTWADGRKYVGQFKHAKFDGQGTYTSPDGWKYVGQLRDDKREGQGTYTSLNGVFVGAFKEDVLCKGKFTGQDGTVLTGVFGCGTKAGTIDYPDGRKYDGEWNGDARFLGVVETAARGNWIFEVPHGVGKMMYPDGKIEEGIWQKGKFLGKLHKVELEQLIFFYQ